MMTQNEELLAAINLSTTESDERLHLDSHQIEMLLMNENHIENGNLISKSDLKKLIRNGWTNDFLDEYGKEITFSVTGTNETKALSIPTHPF